MDSEHTKQSKQHAQQASRTRAANTASTASKARIARKQARGLASEQVSEQACKQKINPASERTREHRQHSKQAQLAYRRE